MQKLSTDSNFVTGKNWYVIDVNPQPWAVGPIQTGRRSGRVYATMGQNQQLASFQEAVRSTLLMYYPDLVSFSESVDPSLFGSREVELCFYFFQKQETAEKPDARTKSGKRQVTSKLADLTNMVKAAEDAIAGILFDNDVQVRAQRNVTVEHGPDVPEGMIVFSIEGFAAMDPNELPQFVWDRIAELDEKADVDTAFQQTTLF